MIRIEMPSRLWRSFSRLSTSPWIDTSRPAVGSSAITSRGSSATARATPMRRAWPPESWWG